ncbi:MAG TPA: hypothetical protein VH120_17495, partial [Gemmataceae bacterium]|nr:hypothetical protein [Gemmataceae bacterium]
MTCKHLVLRVVIACTFVLTADTANGQTWTGAVNTDWNTAGNWSPATVPNSVGANVNFPGGAVGTVNISASVSANQLTFSNATGGYTLTSSSNQTLSMYLAPLITVAAEVTGTETINLTNLASGSLLNNSGNVLSIVNNGAVNAGSLVIGPNTVIGAAFGAGVAVAGHGFTEISGSFSSSNPVNGGLTKTGPGELTFNGNGSSLVGGLTLGGGQLTLDYSANPASKLGGGGLTLAGGDLFLVPNSGTAVTQSIPGATAFTSGHTKIGSLGGVSALTLAAGAMTRAVGATADFIDNGGNNPHPLNVTTSATNTNGLLGTGPAFATFEMNGYESGTWATVSGGSVAGLTNYGTNVYGSGVNTDVTTSTSVAGITTNSLRFNTGSPTLTLSGTNTLQSGGILVTPLATAATITGGTLTAPGSGELIVHQYSQASPNFSLTINSTLVSTAGLTKTGVALLTLGGVNT